MIHHLTKDRQSSGAIALLFCGDVVLDVPDPDHWLSGIAPALKAADLVIGHLEVPHTHSKHEMPGDVPAPGADPAHLAALVRAGFHGMTLAGNHIADCGAAGIADTCSELQRLGLAFAGAGSDLAAASAPMVLKVADGRRVGVLSYNCVGPSQSWATATDAGCAYLPVGTVDGGPARPAAMFTQILPAAVEALREDVAALKREADLAVVALHKGTVHTPARVEVYERQLAQAAITAGADLVIGHHAHIVRGIEFVQGKPVYHGLGNGCVVTTALAPGQAHAARAEWVERRKRLFGFEPDPAFVLAPFHPEAVHSFMARVLWHADGTLECGMVPVIVEAPGRPRLAVGDEKSKVGSYLQQICTAAGLPSLALEERSDMVAIL